MATLDGEGISIHLNISHIISFPVSPCTSTASQPFLLFPSLLLFFLVESAGSFLVPPSHFPSFIHPSITMQLDTSIVLATLAASAVAAPAPYPCLVQRWVDTIGRRTLTHAPSPPLYVRSSKRRPGTRGSLTSSLVDSAVKMLRAEPQEQVSVKSSVALEEEMRSLAAQ
jgi:hypothetical protein